nr:MAG TPA: hypothetical protein [Caudoviricetes sp.]
MYSSHFLPLYLSGAVLQKVVQFWCSQQIKIYKIR